MAEVSALLTEFYWDPNEDTTAYDFELEGGQLPPGLSITVEAQPCGENDEGLKLILGESQADEGDDSYTAGPSTVPLMDVRVIMGALSRGGREAAAGALAEFVGRLADIARRDARGGD